MLSDAVTLLIAALDHGGLADVRELLAGILATRAAADANNIIGWNEMSSLELAGIIAMLDIRINGHRPPERAGGPTPPPHGPPAQSPPPCYNATRRRPCHTRRHKGTA